MATTMQLPMFPHDLQRDVDIHGTGANVHDLRSTWTKYVLTWELTPATCTAAQLRRLNTYESDVRIELSKCKPVQNIFGRGSRPRPAIAAVGGSV